jgi:hypothetical protein
LYDEINIYDFYIKSFWLLGCVITNFDMLHAKMFYHHAHQATFGASTSEKAIKSSRFFFNDFLNNNNNNNNVSCRDDE